MKLWLISQSVNTGYDTYDSAVVVAKNEDEARKTHPAGYHWDDKPDHFISIYTTWCHPDKVEVEYLGTTKQEAGVICASFNAG